MNGHNSKKTEEHVVLELFKDCYREFPSGIINATESPDFIISQGPRKKTGIELVRLHLQASQSDPFSYENIRACLETKEIKLVLYRKKRLQEYWLILVVRDPAYRPLYNLHNKLSVWEFPTGFNRVFLFDINSGRVYRLNTG